MKKTLLFTGLFLFCILAVSAAWYLSKFKNPKAANTTPHIAVNTKKFFPALEKRGSELLQYARQHGYNTKVCFLVDMSLKSGRNRFFVYDLTKDSIIDAGLVAHGSCNKTWLSGRQYGNDNGCGCTSLGRYKIGKPYQGRFGRAYKLYGLDTSNSNAYNRFVVLHSFYAVPEVETAPLPICQSNGCPMVSAGFMKKLEPILDGSSRPVCLWIF